MYSVNKLKKVCQVKKSYSMLFLLWPILNIYGLFNEYVGIGDLIIIPYSLFIFIKYKQKFNSHYFSFFLFLLFLSLVSYTFSTNGNGKQLVLSLLRIILYVFCFAVVAPSFIDIRYFLFRYRQIVLIICFTVFFQYLFYYVFAVPTLLILDSTVFQVREVDGYNTLIANFKNWLPYYGFRPCAYFTEVARMGQYIVPCLVLSLFQKKDKPKKDYLFCIITTICLIATKSTNSVIYTFIAWLLWFVFVFMKKTTVFSFCLLTVTLLVAISLLFIIDMKSFWLFSRLGEIGQEGINSGNMRILRGWLIWGQLPMMNKLIGIGLGNISNFIIHHGITTNYDGGYIGYVSGLSEIVIVGGLISFFLFAVLIFRYIPLNCSKAQISLTIILIVMLFSSAILNSPTFGIMIAILENQSKYSLRVRTKEIFI